MAAPGLTLLGLFAQGLPLGWLVAWPPGPINAAMVRRALRSSFWSAWSMSLGACSGDFLWALAVSLGAGSLAARPGAKLVLSALSAGLLLALAAVFLRAAWSSATARGAPEPPPGRLDDARGGYLLGLGIALTSPWNLAFWLGVVGHTSPARGAVASLVFALGVVVGAGAWGAVLSAAVRVGARFATPAWQTVTALVTGLVLLGFGAQSVWQLFGGSSG